jgi:hypothetical protein
LGSLRKLCAESVFNLRARLRAGLFDPLYDDWKQGRVGRSFEEGETLLQSLEHWGRKVLNALRECLPKWSHFSQARATASPKIAIVASASRALFLNGHIECPHSKCDDTPAYLVSNGFSEHSRFVPEIGRVGKRN